MGRLSEHQHIRLRVMKNPLVFGNLRLNAPACRQAGRFPKSALEINEETATACPDFTSGFSRRFPKDFFITPKLLVGFALLAIVK
jgi:hypothetical protein